MSRQLHKKPRRHYVEDKKKIAIAVSNACPKCGDRSEYHITTTILTTQGQIKIHICPKCKERYKKIGEF